MQKQIDDINKKLDFIIEEIALQKEKRQSMDDLMKDLNIIGKDAFQTAVIELDKAGVELDSECLTHLGIKLIKNVKTFNQMLDRLESINDLLKDIEPIARQMGLDAISKLAEFERKGYFEYFKALGTLADSIVKNYKPEDMIKLSENIEILFNIVRNLTGREVLNKIENLSIAICNIHPDDNLDNKSLLKLLKEINSPEIRKTLSFSLRLLKEINK